MIQHLNGELKEMAMKEFFHRRRYGLCRFCGYKKNKHPVNPSFCADFVSCGEITDTDKRILAMKEKIHVFNVEYDKMIIQQIKESNDVWSDIELRGAKA